MATESKQYSSWDMQEDHSGDTADSIKRVASEEVFRRLRGKSIDQLSPGWFHPARKLNKPTAVFSLVSTIVGGGVLSLPFAFAKMGIIVGPLLLFTCAILSEYSISLLIKCARMSGAESYEQVASSAFAYIILMGDMWGPLVSYVFHFNTEKGTSGRTFLLIASLVAPFGALRSLHALRFTSVLLPCRDALVALVYHNTRNTVTKESQNNENTLKIVESNSSMLESHQVTLLNLNDDSVQNEKDIENSTTNVEYVDENYVEDLSFLQRFFIAISISTFALLSAIQIPSIIVIWTFMGSSISVIIGYVIPASCFLNLCGKKEKPSDIHQFCAKLLLVLSIFMIIGGVYEAIQHVNDTKSLPKKVTLGYVC